MNLLKTATIGLTAMGIATAAVADDVRILAYGDSNTWGWVPLSEGYPAQRLPDAKRWAGVLEHTLETQLGKGVTVVVDGLVGRTTDLPSAEPNGLVAGEDFSGANGLPEAIARHQPLDLVVIMLGTNDLQTGHARTPGDVANAAFDLGNIVTASSNTVFSSYGAPQVLIVAPPAYGDTSATPLGGLFEAGELPSRELDTAFAAEAKERGTSFFDAGSVTTTDGVDGVHLSSENHLTLGQALTVPVTALLGNK